MSTRTAIVITNDATIAPFDEPARDILVLNERLADYQDRLLAARSIPVRRVAPDELAAALAGRPANAPTLVFDERLFFSPELLDEFLRRSAGRTTRACLCKSVFAKQLAVLQAVPDEGSRLSYPLFHCLGPTLDERTAEPVEIDPDEYFEEGSFPPHMLGKDGFKYSVSTRPLMCLTEPLHIGLMNIAANFARVARLRRPGLLGGLKALWAALTACTLNRTAIKARVLRALSVVDRRAEVHPTAVIEGSVIGPGAKIGAHAVVRCSVVGAKAFIDDHAGIKFSVIGEGAYVANNNVIFFTTVYPRAFLISGPYQFCCFGRDTAIMNSIPTDYRLDGKTITVATEQGLQDTGLRFAGSIFGHGTRVAAGLIIGPGRVVPGGLTLYPDPARVLTRIPTDLPEQGPVWFLKDGRLTDAP